MNSSSEQLTFTLFIALIAHLLLLLGVSFVAPKGLSFNQAREVTLVLDARPNDDVDADFLAQLSSQASGEAAQAQQLTSEFQSELQALLNQQVMEQGGQPLTGEQELLLALTLMGEWLPDDQDIADQGDNPLAEDLVSQELATLTAQLAERTQSYARQPRITTISSVSASRAVEAEYLFNWQQRVERVGNANFPQQAVRQQLTGDVRLLVAIGANGQIEYVQMRASSGQPLLDAAAQQIVRLSGPFAPLPREMNTDILEIIRTFRFRTELEVGGQ